MACHILSSKPEAYSGPVELRAFSTPWTVWSANSPALNAWADKLPQWFHSQIEKCLCDRFPQISQELSCLIRLALVTTITKLKNHSAPTSELSVPVESWETHGWLCQAGTLYCQKNAGTGVSMMKLSPPHPPTKPQTPMWLSNTGGLSGWVTARDSHPGGYCPVFLGKGDWDFCENRCLWPTFGAIWGTSMKEQPQFLGRKEPPQNKLN